MAKRWMLVSEAAEVLGVSESTVRRRAGKGELSSRRNKDDVLQVHVAVKAAPKVKLPETEPAPAPESTKATPTASNEPKRLLANKAWAHLASSTPPKHDDLSLDAVDTEDFTTPQVDTPETETPAPAASTETPTAQAAPQVFPNLTMADITPPADGEEESELRKFQRLAGASLVVAQRQTDEANEKLAIVRNELHRARRLGQYVTAAAIAFGFLFTVSWFSGGGSAQPASADSVITPEQLQQQQQVEAAQAQELAEARKSLQQMQQQLNTTLQRLDAQEAK